MEYLFKNEDKRAFKDLTGDEMKIVVDGAKHELTEFLDDENEWGVQCEETPFYVNDVFRVKMLTYTIEDAREDLIGMLIYSDDTQAEMNFDSVNSVFDKLAASMEGKQ